MHTRTTRRLLTAPAECMSRAAQSPGTGAPQQPITWTKCKPTAPPLCGKSPAPGNRMQQRLSLDSSVPEVVYEAERWPQALCSLCPLSTNEALVYTDTQKCGPGVQGLARWMFSLLLRCHASRCKHKTGPRLFMLLTSALRCVLLLSMRQHPAIVHGHVPYLCLVMHHPLAHTGMHTCAHSRVHTRFLLCNHVQARAGALPRRPRPCQCIQRMVVCMHSPDGSVSSASPPLIMSPSTRAPRVQPLSPDQRTSTYLQSALCLSINPKSYKHVQGQAWLSKQQKNLHGPSHSQRPTNVTHALMQAHVVCTLMFSSLRAPHAVQETRESVPVVEHEVAHAQEGDLLQPARARVPAKRALCDAVKGVVIVPASHQGCCARTCVRAAAWDTRGVCGFIGNLRALLQASEQAPNTHTCTRTHTHMRTHLPWAAQPVGSGKGPSMLCTCWCAAPCMRPHPVSGAQSHPVACWMAWCYPKRHWLRPCGLRGALSHPLVSRLDTGPFRSSTHTQCDHTRTTGPRTAAAHSRQPVVPRAPLRGR